MCLPLNLLMLAPVHTVSTVPWYYNSKLPGPLGWWLTLPVLLCSPQSPAAAEGHHSEKFDPWYFCRTHRLTCQGVTAQKTSISFIPNCEAFVQLESQRACQTVSILIVAGTMWFRDATSLSARVAQGGQHVLAP